MKSQSVFPADFGQLDFNALLTDLHELEKALDKFYRKQPDLHPEDLPKEWTKAYKAKLANVVELIESI